MARPTPRKFNPEEIMKFQEAAARQTSKVKTPLTIDELKYPMFEIPINEKKVVYVPNFTKMELSEELGIEVPRLVCDRGAYHMTKYRGSYVKYRCIGDISGIEGFDGTCPLCETMPENWELYHILYAEEGVKKGIDINSEAAKEGLKEERRKLVSDMVVSNKTLELTFPIVEIELQPGSLNPVITADGKMKGTIKWYNIKEDTYYDKWIKGLAAYPEEQQDPAGKWFILDYTYECKTGNPTKMKSASSLKVIPKPADPRLEKMEKEFDESAKEWTPALAMTTIYANMPYGVEELNQIADEVMVPTRDKLLFFDGVKNGGTQAAIATNINSPEYIAANFSAVPQTEPNGSVGAMPEQ